MEKQTLFSYLDKNAAIFTQLSDDIWEHPELSLSQLAELCSPPVTKSCLNHRLRKLLELGKENAE